MPGDVPARVVNVVIPDVRVNGRPVQRGEEVLTPEALEFVADLQRRFGPRRDELLARRKERRGAIARSGRLDFLPETADVRADPSWRVASAPPDLQDRRVEIGAVGRITTCRRRKAT
jgi:malate synthase